MKTSWLARRKTLVMAAIILAAAGWLWACWRQLTVHPSAWMVRWQVVRYLKKHSSSPNFQIAFPFPSKAEMAKTPPRPANAQAAIPKGKLTGKDFDTLAGEYFQLKSATLRLEREVSEAEAELQVLKPKAESLAKEAAEAKSAGSTNLTVLNAQLSYLERRVANLEKKAASRPDLESKQTALTPIVSDLWDFQRTWAAEIQEPDPADTNTLAGAQARFLAETRQRIQDTSSYEGIYRVIGQQVWVAGRLLKSANPEHRRAGVAVAMDASRHAAGDAQNGWLAGRIVQGYVWPHLDVATDWNRRSPFNFENLLETCAEILGSCDDFGGVVTCYQRLLVRAKTVAQADQARAQIAMAYEQAGNPGQAIRYLRQIQSTNDFRWATWRIPRLERQMRGER